MFDYETADKLVDPQIHEAFFVTAVSNSCVNPIIYGNYMKKYWRNIRNAACRSGTSSTSSSRIASSSRTHHHRNSHPQQHNHHSLPQHPHRSSTYRCAIPNHHFRLSPGYQSRNPSDVTMWVNKTNPLCILFLIINLFAIGCRGCNNGGSSIKFSSGTRLKYLLECVLSL